MVTLKDLARITANRKKATLKNIANGIANDQASPKSQKDIWPEAKGAKGDPGITPHIGANSNWFIGETDTGFKAEGQDGQSTFTYYQDATPTEPSLNELWYKPAVKTLYRYNGTSWDTLVSKDELGLGNVQNPNKNSVNTISLMNDQYYQIAKVLKTSFAAGGDFRIWMDKYMDIRFTVSAFYDNTALWRGNIKVDSNSYLFQNVKEIVLAADSTWMYVLLKMYRAVSDTIYYEIRNNTNFTAVDFAITTFPTATLESIYTYDTAVDIFSDHENQISTFNSGVQLTQNSWRQYAAVTNLSESNEAQGLFEIKCTDTANCLLYIVLRAFVYADGSFDFYLINLENNLAISEPGSEFRYRFRIKDDFTQAFFDLFVPGRGENTVRVTIRERNGWIAGDGSEISSVGTGFTVHEYEFDMEKMLETRSGAQTKVDDRLSSTEKENLDNYKSTDGEKTFIDIEDKFQLQQKTEQEHGNSCPTGDMSSGGSYNTGQRGLLLRVKYPVYLKDFKFNYDHTSDDSVDLKIEKFNSDHSALTEIVSASSNELVSANEHSAYSWSSARSAINKILMPGDYYISLIGNANIQPGTESSTVSDKYIDNRFVAIQANASGALPIWSTLWDSSGTFWYNIFDLKFDILNKDLNIGYITDGAGTSGRLLDDNLLTGSQYIYSDT